MKFVIDKYAPRKTRGAFRVIYNISFALAYFIRQINLTNFIVIRVANYLLASSIATATGAVILTCGCYRRRYSLGEIPTILLNSLLKVFNELNPHFVAIDAIFIFLEFVKSILE